MTEEQVLELLRQQRKLCAENAMLEINNGRSPVIKIHSILNAPAPALPQPTGEEAVDFGEWLGTLDLKRYPEGWCQPGGNNGHHYTTAELYKTFKNNHQ
jgi:hypothetical protein